MALALLTACSSHLGLCPASGWRSVLPSSPTTMCFCEKLLNLCHLGKLPLLFFFHVLMQLSGLSPFAFLGHTSLQTVH